MLQGGRPLERYVEEFLELSYRVSWHDAALGACFQLGLDENTIRCDLPTYDFPLFELINLVLYLNGSNSKVEEIKENINGSHLAPTETHRASPTHPVPGLSTYLANGSDHPSPPVLSCTRRRTAYNADLGAKVYDPAFQSVRSVLKAASLPLSPVTRSVPILSPESPAAPESSPPAAAHLSLPASSLSSAQKRRMWRKRLWAPAPERPPVPVSPKLILAGRPLISPKEFFWGTIGVRL